MAAVQYSFQHTRAGDDPWAAFSGGDKIPNSPEHLVSLKLVLPLKLPELKLASRIGVESGRRDRAGKTGDPAVLWDVALSGEIKSMHVRYVAGVRNLLDWQVRYPLGEDELDTTASFRGLTFHADLVFWY
jgi:hypothetical protein